MGDVTSTCCQNSTHLQQANLTRQISVIQQTQPLILPQQPFHQAPQNIKQTLRYACQSKFFQQSFQQSQLQLNLTNNSQVFSPHEIITISCKNRPSPRNSNSILDLISPSSNGQYSTYIKSLHKDNQVITTSRGNQFSSREQNNQLKVNDSQIGNQKILTGLYLVYFPKKQYFLGYLNKNQPTNGVFVFKAGCYYVGNIKDLHAQGQGKYQNTQNGYIYEGSWSKNLIHGYGQEVYTDKGETFQGQFMYGSKFGEGTYNFNDGRVYKGYFYNGHSDGVGTLTVNKKQWYKGEWKLGSIEGHGEYHYSNGDVYTGNFQNGLKSGQGKYLFAAGFSYQGQWLNGTMHGRGIIKEGFDQIQGEWIQGKKVA